MLCADAAEIAAWLATLFWNGTGVQLPLSWIELDSRYCKKASPRQGLQLVRDPLFSLLVII